MPWPFPAPGDISGRAAAVYEAEFPRIFALKNPGVPVPPTDARSPLSTLAVHGRVIELSAYDIYLYISRLAQELMPDTAIDWLPRHCANWGVARDQPTAAVGNVIVLGTPDLVVPAGQTLSAPTAALYTSTAAGTLSSSGTATLPIAAAVAGSAGNLAAGVVLKFVSPVDGLSPQTATVDASGISDGQDLESPDGWRGRLIKRIQQRGAGGDISDYIQWVGEVLQSAILQPTQMALGQVNVFLAINQPNGAGPRVPTSDELAVVTAYLTDATNRKPLGMSVYVTAMTLVPVPVAISVLPNTQAVQTAAAQALQAFFTGQASNAPASGANWIMYMSELDNALSDGSGETSHDRTLPSSDQTYTAGQLPTLGALSFGGG